MAFVGDGNPCDYHCHAWLDGQDHQQQPLPSNPDGESEPEPVLLSIKLHTRIAPRYIAWASEPEPPTRVHSLLVPRDQLLVNDSATLQRRLTEIEIPMDAHSILTAGIRQCAVQTLSADRGGGGGGEVIGMGAVLISRWRWTDIEDDDDAVVLEENDGGGSEELAEAMVEKVRVCGGGAAAAAESCVICMEEIPIGGEAGRMGCKHLYHEDCILNWLRKTPSCPLCRFSICSD
ncbi:E3 ubiquitin-protein ligase RING1-like [Linum perenne]